MLGIVMGLKNPQVNVTGWLGLGLGLKFLNPSKTRTPSAGQGYLGWQKYTQYSVVER